MNLTVTDIQLNGNDTVSFYNGTTLVKTMSRIIPTNPNFFSYRYDTITIQSSSDETLSFQVYPILNIASVPYTALNFNSTPDDVEAKTVQIYVQLTTYVFDGCCDCGGAGAVGDCNFLFQLDPVPVVPPVVPTDGGFVLPNYQLYNFVISNYTYNLIQDLSNFFPIISVGSWIYFYNIDDPANYKILQVNSYDGSLYPIAQFATTTISESGRFDNYGSKYCFTFTAGAGVSNQNWQQTLDQGSFFDKENTINASGFSFNWRNLDDYKVAGSGITEIGNWDFVSPSSKFIFAADSSGAKILATNGVTEINVSVQNIGVSINTPDVVSSTALPGYVLKLQADGTAEFEDPTAGTGTVQSVGLSMPSAFSLNGTSPITTIGTFNVTAVGDVTEFIDGTGSLQTLPVYIAESGLNNLTSPLSFRLGGQLLEDAIINTDGYIVSVNGPAGQNGTPPFAVSSLGTAGLANFYNYAQSTRNAVVISNEVSNTFAPLLLRNSFNSTTNKTLLSLEQTGLTTNPTAASISIDYNLNAGIITPLAAKLTAAIHTLAAAPNYRSLFSIETAWSAAGVSPVLSVLSTGQIKFNAYVPSAFQGVAQSLLAVNSSGEVVTTGAGGFIVSVSGTSPIQVTSGINPVISMPAGSSVQDGYLTATAYNLFSNKQNQITLTTIGTSGAATFVGNVLNIPQYVGNQVQAGSGLSQSSSIISLGYPTLAAANASPLTQGAFIDVGSNTFNITGNRSQSVLLVKNVRTNSNVSPSFRSESDGGNAIEAFQTFTGTVTPSYIGKTAAVFAGSNVGMSHYGISSRYTSAYFELNNVVQVDYPALHVVKDERSRTSTYDEVLRIERQGPGFSNQVPLSGFGAVSSYWLRYGSPTSSVAKAGSVGFAWVDPTVKTSEFIVAPTLVGVENIRLKIKGDGQMQLASYTSTSSFPGSAEGVLGFDSQGNIITVTGGGGGGGSINGAYNGLSVDGDQIILGGPLVSNTIIYSNTRSLQVIGDVASAQGPSFYVENTNAGVNPTAIRGKAMGSFSSTGVYGESDFGVGVYGTSNNRVGVSGFSTDGYGVIGVSTNNFAGQFVSSNYISAIFSTNNSSGSTVFPLLYMQRDSSSSASNGIGGSIIFETKAIGGTDFSSEIVSKWTDATYATRTSQFEIKGQENAGGLQTHFTIKGTGQIQFNKYNNPSFFGGAVSAYLAVDASGNIIQTTGATSSGITGLIGDVYATGPGTAASTIQAGVVTYSKIQNVAANSFLANLTASSASVQEIATNRIPLFSSAIIGTPSATTFLRGDGSWATSSGTLSSLTDVQLGTLSNGQVLQYNSSSSKWQNATVAVLTDGNKGDITVSSSGATWTINNGVVTYNKLQAPSAGSKILGSAQSTTAYGELSVTNGLSILGSDLVLGGTLNSETQINANGFNLYILDSIGSVDPILRIQDNSTQTVGKYVAKIETDENQGLQVLTNGEFATASAGFAARIVGTKASGLLVSAAASSLGFENFALRVTSRLGSSSSAFSSLYSTAYFYKVEEYANTQGGAAESTCNYLSLDPSTTNYVNQGLEHTFRIDQLGNDVVTSGSKIGSIRVLTTSRSGTNNWASRMQLLTAYTGVSLTQSRVALELGSTGQIKLPAYLNSTSFVGTATAALAVDASGNVITVAAGGGVTDGNKGDITVSASGATWTINNTAVTYAKIQNVAANSFLANATGSAATVQEISTSRIPLFASAITGTPSATTFLRGDGLWSTPSGSSPLTTKGDLYTFSTVNTRLPVGTNGQVLVADNTTATGLKWDTAPGLTSVGLSMPVAFSVANSPLTTNGTIAVTGAGTSAQYIRGDGSLGIFPSQGGGGGGTVYYLNGNTSQGSIGGTTMYQLSRDAATGASANFTRSTAGTIVSFITNSGDPNQLSIPAGIWVFEAYLSESGGGSAHATIQAVIEKWDGSTITVISTGPAEEITNGSSKDLYQFGVSIPSGTTLSLTDRIVIQLQVANSNGKTVTLYTEDGNISSLTTTFANGISSLNGLTASAQTFSIPGTSGTAPAWTSSGSIHTLDIPLASASSVTAGLISNAQYTTFNNKANSTITISTTSPLSGGGDLSANRTISIADAAADGSTKGAAAFNSSDFNSASGVISIDYANGQAASSSNKGFLTSADWTTFNGKQNNIGLTTVGTSLATLTDPSAISYLRINANNTVSAITASQLISDLGIINNIQLFKDFTVYSIINTSAHTNFSMYTVAANSLAVNDFIEIFGHFNSTQTTGTLTYRLYVNTTPVFAGATLLATYAPSVPNTNLYEFSRQIAVTAIGASGNLRIANTTANLIAGGNTSSTISNITINTTGALYFMFSAQMSVTTATTTQQMVFARINR